MEKTSSANSDMIGEYMLHNGLKFRTDQFDLSPSADLPGIYEVIRIIEGAPLFFEDHFERLLHSAKLLGYNIKITRDTMYSHILNVVSLNSCMYGNVKIIINKLDTPDQQVYVFFTHSKYPTEDEVTRGVHATLYHAERNNPNAKSMNLSYREKIQLAISNTGSYEALLVNKNGEITEGSKSNFFAVKGDIVYTSPVKDVLPGITRQMVMKICASLKYEVQEMPIPVQDLIKMDGIFMTGTSPQVLPISSVDDMTFNSSSNEIITNIKASYQKLVDSYIHEKNK